MLDSLWEGTMFTRGDWQALRRFPDDKFSIFAGLAISVCALLVIATVLYFTIFDPA